MRRGHTDPPVPTLSVRCLYWKSREISGVIPQPLFQVTLVYPEFVFLRGKKDSK